MRRQAGAGRRLCRCTLLALSCRTGARLLRLHGVGIVVDDIQSVGAWHDAQMHAWCHVLRACDVWVDVENLLDSGAEEGGQRLEAVTCLDMCVGILTCSSN